MFTLQIRFFFYKTIWFHIIAISFNDTIAFSDSCQIIYTDSPNVTYLFIERYQW